MSDKVKTITTKLVQFSLIDAKGKISQFGKEFARKHTKTKALPVKRLTVNPNYADYFPEKFDGVQRTSGKNS
ncbi:hypothetical protein [Turneriella parva]|uniref:hypothetical protein n=1 Tax=Turneriella parva TaxID=29510 RepID=UPI0012F6EFDF|nr:hypothetical protein [Turneriella parva]